MLSISPFQFFISFSCVFIKFDTKFYRATLLEISFLHFCNASLLHTLTQLTVKSDMLKLLSWNLHWSSSKNVCLGWCPRCGYSIASCRATHSVSLLSWRTVYMIISLKYLIPLITKIPFLIPVAVSAAVSVSFAGTSLVVAAASCWLCIQELLWGKAPSQELSFLVLLVLLLLHGFHVPYTNSMRYLGLSWHNVIVSNDLYNIHVHLLFILP